MSLDWNRACWKFTLLTIAGGNRAQL